ncbi:phosphoribosylaminoimidazole-succinocarboxamide synthase protein [Diplodia corticola]|uniref:Phosphoribosylaminoimidazole-succinocarboxamide synthase protein n=1 Tax=Diplodia corticola TaxID=236234 RepID=A0A1J9SC86_9PEZI|nr:phosphoribosylaminoimidazole-succinocarboxamide synthase protein [Diplodia corticola]OJD37452.1 phosphoribosylaminoimidazole-succinocarboxamide synthase protein [Diplodia corticola]
MSSNEPLLALKHTNGMYDEPGPPTIPAAPRRPKPCIIRLTAHAVSRPHIQHSASQQSISASEDYYTVSEISTSSGDDRSQTTIIRHNTPPELYRTPLQSHEQLTNPRRLSTLQEARKSREANTGVPRTVNFDETSIPQRSMPSRGPAVQDPRRKSGRESESVSTTPGVDDTPYIRFAIDQLTRDEEVRGSRKYPAGTRASAEQYPVQRLVSPETVAYVPQAPTYEADETPERNPSRPAPMEPLNVQQRDIFVPYHPQTKSVQFPPLTFLPSILRPLWLGIFASLCVLMITGLIVSAVWSDTYSGLLDYGSLGDGSYFLFQYVPTIFGMVILVWLHQIVAALQRISPFMALASESSKSRSEGVFLDLYPTQFLYPTLQHFRAGQPLIGVFYIISWIFLFTIPLLGSAYNVRFFGALRNGTWRWLAVQGVIWAVVALYFLLIAGLICVVVQLRKPTGLKWDPRSIADYATLLERSNAISDYSDTEILETSSEFRERLASRTDRLGYWNTSARPNDIFYGLGEPGGDPRRYTVVAGRLREKQDYASEGTDLEAARPGDLRLDIRVESVRRRYLPWFLTDSYVVAWIIAAVVLYLTFLIVSFVNDAVIQGFDPRVSVAANPAGFSASNFLYSFLPILLTMFLYLFFQTLDFALRRLAPYEALCTPGGASAETSILLDYPARLPVSVTLAAIANHHWRVALFSFVSLMTAFTLPVLASGLFFTQYYPSDGTLRVAAHPAAYYALCVFLAIYIVAVCMLATGRSDMALPHDSRTLAETVSWLYQSRMLTDRAFSRPATKAELVARLMGPVYLEKGFNRSLRSLAMPGAAGAFAFGSSKASLRAAAEKQQKEQNDMAAAFSATGHHDDGHGHGRVGSASSRHHNYQFIPEDESMMHVAGHAVGPDELRAMAMEKRRSLIDPGSIMYGFGVHWGRDGREHLGVDRVQRGESRMMHFD